MTKLYVQKLFLCKGVRNGYLLGHNADILWSEYTYVNRKHQLMAHTADYDLVPYRPILLQYSEILAYYWWFKVKHQFMSHFQK